jgi:hypothetical protein
MVARLSQCSIIKDDEQVEAKWRHMGEMAQSNRVAGQQVIFSTFETAQIESMYCLQDMLTHTLLEMPEDGTDNAGDLLLQHFLQQVLLALYIGGLKRLHWCLQLPKLGAKESKEHAEMLSSVLGNDEHYKESLDYMDTSNVILNSSSTIGPLCRTLHNMMPPSMTPNGASLISLREKLRNVAIKKSLKKTREPEITSDISPKLQCQPSRNMTMLIVPRVPIIVMSFLKTANARLITASLFTLAFAILISFSSRASNQEILGGAAAYAAVLVVFIGSALSTVS